MTQIKKTTQRRIPWRTIGVVAAVGIIVAAWWFAGRKVWTDDHGLTVVDGQASLRRVVWNSPKPLGDFFTDDQQRYEPSLSPDGTELYFVSGKPGKNADIYVSYRRNNQWTRPEPVTAVNTPYDELGPRVTADGKFLVFYSDRPGGFGGYDIWASARKKEGWGKPFNLGPTVNSEFNEFTPDPTPDGKHLIFATNREAARRLQPQAWRATVRENEAPDFDLWIADLKEPEQSRTVGVPPVSADGETGRTPVLQKGPVPAESAVPSMQPTAVPSQSITAVPPELEFSPAHEISGINTPFVEGASCMSPAGDFLYFASNRPGGFGKFDIWRCRVSPDWKFGIVENAGSEINSADNETDPTLALNGYRLVFSSDRGSDHGVYQLYSCDSREVYATRQGRPLPEVGRSFWMFVVSVLILLPLLMFLRGWDDNRLNVLQKCLVISLLFHVLLCLGLSFVFVSRDAYHFVRQQLGVEVAINLNPAPEAEIGTTIRRQSIGSDLPMVGAPPRSQRVSVAPLETAIAPGPVDVSLPRATVMPNPLTPAPDVMRLTSPIKSDAVAAQPTAPHTDVPQADPLDLHFNAPHVVSQIEAKPQVQATETAVNKTAADLPQDIEKITAAPSTPVAQAAAARLPIEAGAVATPRLPVGGKTDLAQIAPVVPAAASDAPSVSVANTPVEKVTGKDAAVATGAADGRSAVTASLQAASAVPGTKSDVTPAAGPARPDAAATATPSIVAAATFRPAAGPVVPDAAAPGSANLVAAPDVAAIKATTNIVPVASGQPSAPQIQEASVGSARQGHAVANAQATGIDMPAPRVSASAASAIAAPSSAGAASAVKSIVAGPTTLPSETVASAIGFAPAAPDIKLNGPAAGGPRAATEDHALALHAPAGPAGGESGPIASTVAAPSGGAAQVDVHAAPSRPEAGSGIASDLGVVVRGGALAAVATKVATPAVSIPDAIDGPQIAMPQPAAALASSARPAAAGAGDKAPEARVVALAGKQSLHGPEGGGSKNVSVDMSGPIVASAKFSKESGAGLDPISARPHITPLAPSVAPNIDIGPLPNDIGGGKLNAPDSPFAMRAPEVHRPIIEKLGGSQQSEDAVAKALFWLADNQEDNGRWTMIYDGHTRKHPRAQHDTAMTGLSLLAFLAQDHLPDKPGPYRQTVTRALDYLLSEVRADGDLRGDQPGPGAAQGNMYDHGIATYAMAEAALLTHDPRYTDAAMRAAQYIVDAQNDADGGWRYAPREAGDSSVFGWQIMALHSAERLGFRIPDHTRAGIDHYIQNATSGAHGMLAGYQPRREATPTMTAQMVFSRMLLGRQFTETEMGEASDFLSRTEVNPQKSDLYYWYYASMCMSQMQTPAWKSWNQKTRDTLIALQQSEGEHGGFWQAQVYKGQYSDRVLSTAMGALILEVYYRYMPMQAGNVKVDPASKDAH